jgi:hypothetical protein
MVKEGMPVDQSLSFTLRYTRALSEHERAACEHALTSLGAASLSWTQPAGSARTFLRGFAPEASWAAIEAAAGGSIVPGTPLVVEVAAKDPAQAPRLADAFGGAGRPAAALDCWSASQSICIVWDCRRAEPALLLDLIDVETPGGRAIRFALPPDDATLAALGRAVLRDPNLTPERFIETHVERLARC